LGSMVRSERTNTFIVHMDSHDQHWHGHWPWAKRWIPWQRNER
jgi:hypothetical protein